VLPRHSKGGEPPPEEMRRGKPLVENREPSRG